MIRVLAVLLSLGCVGCLPDLGAKDAQEDASEPTLDGGGDAGTDSAVAPHVSVELEAEDAELAASAEKGTDSAASGGEIIVFRGATTYEIDDFGATPNDAGDDAAEIQEALNLAAELRGTVIVPPGVFRVSVPLRLPLGTELIGYGSNRSSLEVTSNDITAVIMGTGTKIRGLTIKSSANELNCAVAAHGVDLGASMDVLVEDVVIDGFGCQGVSSGLDARRSIVASSVVQNVRNHGFDIQGTDNFFIEHNRIQNVGGNGIGTQASNTYIRFNDIAETGRECAAENLNCGPGIVAGNGDRGDGNNVIEGNMIDAGGLRGIWLLAVPGAGRLSTTYVNHNVIEDSFIAVALTCWKTGEFACDANQISGNVLRTVRSFGIVLGGGTRTRASYNTVIGVDNDLSFDGIIVASSEESELPSENVIEQNVVTNFARWGIATADGSGHRVVDNYVYDNGIEDIHDTATGTHLEGNVDDEPTEALPAATRSRVCAPYPTDRGTATLTFDVPRSATYRIWARVAAETTLADSLYVRVDDGCPVLFGNVSSEASAYTWTSATWSDAETELSVDLDAGEHTIQLIGREADTTVDRIILTTDEGCVPIDLGTNC